MKPFCYHPFDLRQLVSFAEIARTGSFRQAAKVLHIAQPALSRQIKQLEAALGISLFDRAPRRLHLTIEGRDVLPPKKRTRNSRFSLVCHRRNRVTLSPEPPGIFRLGLAPAGPALRPVDRLEATHACRLQGCASVLEVRPRRSKSSSLVILIMIYSVPCLAPALRSLLACWPRLAMTASDSTAMLKIYNALAEQPR
jgi:hypothetical protein